MPIACMLGLTACLTFGDAEFTANDAFEIMDDCDLLQQLPVSAYGASSSKTMTIGDTMGLTVADSIRKKGIKLVAQNTPQQRRGAWLNTCRLFKIAFHDDLQWKNLDKWPD